MSEWWTYRPEDLLLFSPRTYWRLFELANAELWPLQILIFGVGTLMLICVIRPTPWSNRMVAGAMALAWTITGFWFIGSLYAEINWVAVYAVPAFAAEATLLLWFGVIRKKLSFTLDRKVSAFLGFGLFNYALLLHPLVAPLAGRPIAAAEIIGIAPDPTAIATLGLLSTCRCAQTIWLILMVPVLWCLLSATTLLTMGTWEWWIPSMSVTLAIAAQIVAPSNTNVH